MNNEQMTIKEAMEFLGVSRPTIYSLIDRKLLERHEELFGSGRRRVVYFLRADVEALARGEVPAPAPTDAPAPKAKKRKGK